MYGLQLNNLTEGNPWYVSSESMVLRIWKLQPAARSTKWQQFKQHKIIKFIFTVVEMQCEYIFWSASKQYTKTWGLTRIALIYFSRNQNIL